MLCTGGHNIDSRGIDAAVAQNIRQLGNVHFDTVECPGKQLAQIIGKNFGRRYSGLSAKLLHLPSDAASIQRPSILSAENNATGNLISFCIIYKQLSQLTRNQNGPGFAFAVYGYGSHHFQSEVPQFRNTDSSAADGLQNQIQLLFSPECFQEPQMD